MGVKQIKTVLHKKKVLIVLDDVNKIDQITLLCGSREWLGAGSVILITTRYKHILDQLKVDNHFKVKKMDKNESLELFSCHAFKQLNPPNEFITFSKKAVTFCGELPLALEVLGSLLIDKTLREWKSLIKKLPRLKSNAILEILQLSYEYLENSEKDVFLEIASFYVGKDRQHVTEILNEYGFCAEVDISVLIARGLLKVDKNNKFEMHEYFRDMAKRMNPPKTQPKYANDVFLSFRGEDTRKSFVGHLHATLKNAGSEVFMDDNLKKGKNISASLLQAIEVSRISIIVFSTNYASSSWCLEELEKIMECHRHNGQQIMPVFYDVQAFEVRKQIGNFGKAFHELIARISTRKEQTWRRELTAAANISGWDSYNYRNDAALINHIVESVMMKLDDKAYLFIADHPVGVESRMQEITKLLSGKSNEIIMVGIWGMGGIGKTTIAKAIFNELGRNFEGKFFLENVRKFWEQANGPINLQEQLLAGISRERITRLQHNGLGKNVMKERLCHKRALLVLDDVDKSVQISTLCGSREWFAPGSRIIITTRDKHLLDLLQVDKVYNMKELEDFESLELFSWHAFKQVNPIENYVELSKRVIAYSRGLPLALEVLGSYLFDRAISAWESVLEKLQKIPNDHIYEKLKISYDGLSDHMEKDIFLDICCFFIGEDRSYVTQILNGCGLHAEIGITRLIEQSLIRVYKNNKLGMHSLLCDMGREIIRETSPKPEERSRLWFYDEVLYVLKNNMGTKSVKGLALNLSRNNTLSFNTKAFKEMKRLQLLQLNHVRLLGDHEYLSKDLRWLRWHGFPLSYMPENFCQENLIAVDLKYSGLIQVWKDSQMLERMKILNLSHSCYLEQTPDFSKLPNLEELILEDCKSLSVVHSSIGCLKYLILLNLRDCERLIHLPRSIYNLKNLKTFNIDGCSKIDKLEEDIEQMESLTTLMANQTAITQVPFSLMRSKSIKYVSLCGYEGLSHNVFPPLIWSWMSPKSIPKSLIWSIPYLFQGLSRSLFAKSSAMMRSSSSKSQVSCKKTPATVDFHEQVLMPRLENFMSSLIIRVGEFNKDIDTLLKHISQGLSEFGDSSLPGDNYPKWLNFNGEGSSILFKVPQVPSRNLKGLILYIVYISHEDNMASAYPVSVLVSNHTKVTIEFYKLDTVIASADEELGSIIPNLEPENEVEFKVTFAHKFDIKKTIIYLVYDEDVGKRIMN
ncbi:TMV resistance protein N-like [Neltuma alba]|uniref:TMV resistance protein N-like n=1 Tax=Neltuma alba TaxID=207710 RepID=UPI0010A4FF87|nr:TMV resistance protein N-like [Prosopis alba]